MWLIGTELQRVALGRDQRERQRLSRPELVESNPEERASCPASRPTFQNYDSATRPRSPPTHVYVRLFGWRAHGTGHESATTLTAPDRTIDGPELPHRRTSRPRKTCAPRLIRHCDVTDLVQPASRSPSLKLRRRLYVAVRRPGDRDAPAGNRRRQRRPRLATRYLP